MRLFHGTATEYQPGDLIKPEYAVGFPRGQGRTFATTSPEVARDYAQHKADALYAGYRIEAGPRAYEVEPTGHIEPDPAVDEKFGAWQSRAPMRVIADVTTPEPEAEAG